MTEQNIASTEVSSAPALGYTDDLEKAANQGIPLNPQGDLRVRINDKRLRIADPVPTARQLLKAAKLMPVEQYVLFYRLPDGDLESLRLDETVDLRERGVERFLAFESDRIFLFKIDGRRQEWGAETITGKALLRLAGKSPKHFGVWRVATGTEDVRISAQESTDLSDAGLECFRTAYVLCIEGKEIPWGQPTITTEQIAELGGWDVSQGVVEVDPDQNERTLAPGEVVKLKDGHGFGKKFQWKRGLYANPRIDQELDLLRPQFVNIECQELAGSYWFLVPSIELPDNCHPRTISVVFSVTTGHPGAPPYGFYLPANVTRDSVAVSTQAPPAAPPFAGEWRFVSHQPTHWQPAAAVEVGDNLWGWTRSIRDCIGFGE